ncbi:NACHT domain-containing protein [Kitasatospora sp. CB01950]|uniref:NACHT domain-containing protein n=1 Tax=Kitasatospora sp. CB01950 TaxID=1703930 RepID=UPI00093D0850|nr:NACHT domain-containing protein [Kitasatospora sp. CB01950]
MSVIATAAGVLGKLVAKPLTDAALRQERVLRALKAVRLDPRKPPRDFDGIYAYALIEYCANRAESVLAVFRDQYVIDSFRRSFEARDLTRVRREVAEAVERNRETGEFGHLAHGFEEHVDAFAATFEQVVDRTRAPHEARLEETVKALVSAVGRTRDEEEGRRLRIEPGRAELTPAQRLAQDAEEWFRAVGYEIRQQQWPVGEDAVALLVDIPRRRGRFDRTVMLCVAGELGPHHLNALAELADSAAAAEGWGIARLRVSAAARALAEASEERLFCYSFDELIDEEADFEPYLAWVEEEVRRRGIDTRYVPLSCEKDEIDPGTGQRLATSDYRWQDGGLDDYVARWLDEPAKQHLSVLGEFGMGKSWFALHLAHTMVQAWRDAKRRGVPRPRLPLLIPLRDYVKQTTVQGLLAEFFFDKHKIDLRSADVVRVLNRMGRLLLIFDGFDEMAARADRNTVVANFWSLASAVDQGAKVLLSSRKEHFRDAQEARDLFGAKISASGHGTIVNGPTFDIVELVPFDDEQIERMLRNDLGDDDKVRTVMGHPDVLELMRRPVMSELVIDALPEIEHGAEVDLARIYLYAVQRKMDRDVLEERTFTSRADKLYFLCEVAWEMLSTDRLTLNYRDFPDHLRNCFGPAVQSAKDLDFWEQDMRNQGMLVRNAEGDYGPSHKSLLEFLVALRLVAELGMLEGDFLAAVQPAGSDGADGMRVVASWSEYFTSRGPDGSLAPLESFATESIDALARSLGSLDHNRTVFEFMAAMVRDRPENLARLVKLTGHSDTGRLDGNCLNLAVYAGFSLAGASLPCRNLYGFGAWDKERRTSLADADLRDTDLRLARLSRADLAGADLTGARLRNELLHDEHHRDVLLMPDGTVVTAADGSLLHWPGGNLADPPLRLPAGHDRLLRAWDADIWWTVGPDGGRLIRSATGEVVGSTPPLHNAGLAVRWRGRQQVFDAMRHEVRSSHGPAVVEQIPSPMADQRYGNYFSDGSRVGLLAAGPTAVEYLVTDETAAGGWRSVRRAALRLNSDDWFLSSSADSALIAADGRVVGVVDGTSDEVRLTPDGLTLPFPVSDLAGSFLYRTRSGLAALAADGGLRGWRLDHGDQPVLWQHGVPIGVAGLGAAPSGDRLAMATAMGELWLLDFRTGEILARVPLTERLRGTRFSRDCGFDEDTLAAIVRLGGILVE